MAVNLKKGGRVSLSKEVPNLKKIKIGLGWDANPTDTGSQFDLDASLFMLGHNGQVISDEHFIFYNNSTSPCRAVQHMGDNRTGEGDGDDESIEIDLDRVDMTVQRIVFTVTIDEALRRHQNFGQVNNALIRIVNQDNNSEITRYELDEDYSVETAINFGELYRREGKWSFKAVGSGYNAGLEGFCREYGVNV